MVHLNGNGGLQHALLHQTIIFVMYCLGFLVYCPAATAYTLLQCYVLCLTQETGGKYLFVELVVFKPNILRLYMDDDHLREIP